MWYVLELDRIDGKNRVASRLKKGHSVIVLPEACAVGTNSDWPSYQRNESFSIFVDVHASLTPMAQASGKTVKP
jgi:hypothetical protein